MTEPKPIDAGETPDAQIADIELPNAMEIWKRMTALEARGVPIDLECIDCGDAVETRVLRGERDVSRKSICKRCANHHAREKGLLN